MILNPLRSLPGLSVLALLLVLLASVVEGGVAGGAPHAPPPPEGLSRIGAGTVATIIDGDAVVLDDGRRVRLVGIQAPKLPLGRPGHVAWPLAEDARAALAELAKGRAVTLMSGGADRDRHGRTLAHLVRDDGLWLQGALLALGLARVYSFPDNRTGVATMLHIEEQARAAGLGIWAGHPFYAIRDRDTVKRTIDSFEIVEDVVHRVARVRGTVYLNFEPDWRRDFTVKINASTARVFDRGPHDLSQLEGARVRVRGWVTWENGPMIELTHPEQIEIVSDETEHSAPLRSATGTGS